MNQSTRDRIEAKNKSLQSFGETRSGLPFTLDELHDHGFDSGHALALKEVLELLRSNEAGIWQAKAFQLHNFMFDTVNGKDWADFIENHFMKEGE